MPAPLHLLKAHFDCGMGLVLGTQVKHGGHQWLGIEWGGCAWDLEQAGASLWMVSGLTGWDSLQGPRGSVGHTHTKHKWI